jgi:hypothetical protein
MTDRCKCGKRHRTPRTLLACHIPHAAWISGKGNIALIARCGIPTITLHDSTASALRDMEFIDTVGCGHACSGRRSDHVIAWVNLAGQRMETTRDAAAAV